jgi:hypothetical protein
MCSALLVGLVSLLGAPSSPESARAQTGSGLAVSSVDPLFSSSLLSVP